MRSLLIVIVFCCKHLYGVEVIDITKDKIDGQTFGKRSYWYIGEEDIGQVASPQFSDSFVLGENEKHSFGMKSSTFWIRVSFQNPLPSEEKLYIADSSNFAKSVTVYANGKLIGELFHEDYLLRRVVEVVLPANATTTVYINRLSYGSQRQSWTYWIDREKMIHSIRDSERSWSVVMSVFGMSLLFNLMLFYAYRSKVYLFYIGYLLAAGAFTTGVWSIIGFEYHMQFTESMVILAGINAAMFTVEFLNLSKILPLGRKVLLSIVGLWCVPLILVHIAPFLAHRITMVTGALLAVSCIFISSRVYWQTKAAHALIYCMAFGVFLLGILIQTAIWRGMFPSLVSYSYLLMHSAALSDVLMLVAMGYQVHVTEVDRIESHEKLKAYVGKVQMLVDEKTRDIRSMMENIPQGIFTIHADSSSVKGGLIDAEYSAWLLSFTGEQDLAGKSMLEKILRRTNLSNDELDQTLNVLDVSFGENIINFECNSGILVSSCSFQLDNDATAEVEFEWSPVLDDEENIEKFLVTIRDVTEVMKLRREAENYLRETAILSEIARADEQNFGKFISTALQFVNENISKLEDAREIDRDMLKNIFINLHTLKGISRTLKLATLSTTIHDEETVFASYRSIDKHIDLNIEEIKARQQDLLALIREYSRVNIEVLHRNNLETVLSVDRSIVQDTLDSLTKVNASSLIKRDSLIISNIRQRLSGLLFHNATEFYDDLRIVINTLAKDLGKAQPEFQMIGEEILFTNKAMDLLKQIFIHLIRNILDHGLEYPEVREGKGKKPSGTITIHTSLNRNFIAFTVKDDGAGLNLKRIREAAIKNGVIEPDAVLTNYETANLIFESGISTAKKETEISGRGVGMSAVKEFAEKSGGELTLLLGEELEDGNISFSSEILLPAEYFRFDIKTEKAS